VCGALSLLVSLIVRIFAANCHAVVETLMEDVSTKDNDNFVSHCEKTAEDDKQQFGF